MNIVFIHGVNQQRFTATHLAQHWHNILQRGLEHSGLELDLSQHQLHFPYYADLLDVHLPAQLTQLAEGIPLLAPEQLSKLQTPRTPPTPEELEPHSPMLDMLQSLQQLPISQRLYVMSHLAKDHVLKEMVLLLSKFPKLHETVIQRFIVEAYCYLADPAFMQAVHARIDPIFQPDQDYIVVSHSLGSVVAFNLLQGLDASQRVRRFITLASPLAFPVIQQKLKQPVDKPISLHGDWHNYYAEHDYLASYPLQHSPFDFEPRIHNVGIHTFADKPHEIVGYLQHPQVVKSIVQALDPETLPLLQQA